MIPKQSDRQHTVTFHKGYKLFSGITVHGERVLLKGPSSDVQLTIPEGSQGFISGHAHTDIKPFLKHIPQSECLVSPIVEYNSFLSCQSHEGLFEIRVPHCVKDQKQFEHFRVWHGDIHNDVPFVETLTFKVHDRFVTILTSSFSQFFCTICQERCYGNPIAMIFGCVVPWVYPFQTALRVYMCSPLYDILDFKEVILANISVFRHLVPFL